MKLVNDSTLFLTLCRKQKHAVRLAARGEGGETCSKVTSKTWWRGYIWYEDKVCLCSHLSPPPPHCAYVLTVPSKRIMIPFSIQSTIIVQSTHACKLLEGGLNSTFPFFTLNVNKSHVVWHVVWWLSTSRDVQCLNQTGIKLAFRNCKE